MGRRVQFRWAPCATNHWAYSTSQPSDPFSAARHRRQARTRHRWLLALQFSGRGLQDYQHQTHYYRGIPFVKVHLQRFSEQAPRPLETFAHIYRREIKLFRNVAVWHLIEEAQATDLTQSGGGRLSIDWQIYQGISRCSTVSSADSWTRVAVLSYMAS